MLKFKVRVSVYWCLSIIANVLKQKQIKSKNFTLTDPNFFRIIFSEYCSTVTKNKKITLIWYQNYVYRFKNKRINYI